MKSSFETYDEAVDELIRLNKDAHAKGLYVAFSGQAYIFGVIDPSLPYGVIRNGDGRLYDILKPDERIKHPLPEGYRPGALRAQIIQEDAMSDADMAGRY